ncbi:beta/gamma crystallin-related protein [uncultured Kordia sp.]|uniref:beta/gamma crystallin-related protein n=1 Tax=uncultured Kordia sp. TaxID=507699 RepID=UPI0026355161|nr:beta/gamma crystallin-related protein [uncultured Kordia sp.]
MSKIIVFQNSNISGSSLTLTASDPNLVPQGWNDKISSLIVVSGTWELYQNTKYGGSSWSVSDSGGPNGDGVYPDWSDWGGTNDSISSIRCT